MEIIDTKRLLSVSSHVAHGYVGNRSVVFPLQFLGWDVDAINTTDFSNHPGYGTFGGRKSDPETIEKLFNGLETIQDPNDPYKLSLVGYCPSAGMLEVVYDHIEKLKKANPDMLVVVDPVLGDNGRLYVPEEVVPVHKAFFEKGLVSLVTPNQFELELLTGIKIDSWDAAKKALLEFNKLYKVPSVVLSSLVVDGEMASIGLSKNDQAVDIFKVNIDEIGCSFNGCGDVFAALLTHEFHQNGYVLSSTVLGSVVAKMNKILRVSYAVEQQKTGKQPQTVKDIALVVSRHIFTSNEAPGAQVSKLT
ncbi:pyridoxal kinase [Candidozyma haemuli]|uniref:pyridoxal kinase n=1 Tax=Candidozyma haemuli TaxID=45357 RepID=A0A2V1AY31_9ASCO|nr:pyridoxal kinase [[Candida] haemuloni]PVH21751.1 pyridoxal kinase [[Candida] haemuloni]